MVSIAVPSSTSIAAVRVLDEDPDLAAGLTGSRLATAAAQLTARVVRQPTGAWRPQPAAPRPIGLLLLDGIVTREVLMEDTVSAELLGPGDLIRPQRGDASRLLRSQVRWSVVEPVRAAVLGPAFAAAAELFPEVRAALLERVSERADRLALTQAITQLNGVDRRLLTLFWHLAERWGRVGPDGIALPLRLPHRILATLVGARRPTVSVALGRLVADGRVERRSDGGWLLRGDPVGHPTAATARFVPLRRRTVTTARGRVTA